ncbi:MAG: type II toxin-antitoxin system RelE/ParE family toxin [Alphaproteobacteria bacterium]|nr:type II toxin-antitoxin system RelE/ParE family toxin [Alphaproteobacteria bacterium]
MASAYIHSFPVGNYTIFYKQTGTGIVVLRVLHGARDISAAF